MKMTYRFIVVEDVELQRQHIIGLLQSRLDLEFQAAFESAQEAYQYLASGLYPMPDLVFLDVEMPEANGFSLLESLRRMEPGFRIIFVTAFPEYAIKGYEYNASAYLLKPVEPDKLFRAVDKAIRELNTPHAPASLPANTQPTRPFLMIKVKQMLIKLWLDDIIYCEGANVNVRIVTPGGDYITRERLKNIEQQLPTDRFLRIHDSFIINLEDVKGYASNFTTVELLRAELKGKPLSLPVGPKYRQMLKEKLQN